MGCFRSSSVRERKMHWLPLVKAWSGICGRHGLVVYDTRKVVWLWELSNLGVSPCCQANILGYLKLADMLISLWQGGPGAVLVN